MDDIKLWARNACNAKHIKLASENITRTTRENPKGIVYSVLFIIAFFWLSAKAVRRLRSQNLPSRPRTPDLEKPQHARQDSSKSKFAMEQPGGKLASKFLSKSSHC